MRRLFALSVVCVGLSLQGCMSPMPAPDPQMAWIELTMVSGKVIMAERLDGVNWADGRYFQVKPGAHDLMVRFDFEIYGGVGGPFNLWDDERLCYLNVRYDSFKAGEHYRLQARSLGLQPMAWLYDSHGQKVAEDSEIHCMP
ncbi:hypothetical protein [Pseudomonas sp. dw_358]|uniref:PA0061/PA0062 family lipoprotein n=1 Tax=Pseudomonas sp. dw_358 TaxID=2720083 RepID=UPI001BD66CA5|nr:hypothetical protein [Pseudomonas sp. dw_358]